MTRKQLKALRRTKAIKKKQNINKAQSAAAIVAAGAVLATSNISAQIEEIVVTSRKKEETLQDVPLQVSTLTEESLEASGINTFEDYLLELPGVTAGGSGPGQNTIYIRGLASTTPNLTTAGVAGLAPNVSFYLDEQPLAQPGRNLDVYAADMARIEVLSGPQGTLFGASSQAGVVRMITNKPKMGVSESNVEFEYRFTPEGDTGSKIEAMTNIPLGESTALRVVAYKDEKGGYIDQVAGKVDASASARFRPAGTVRQNGLPVSSSRAGFQAGADLSGATLIPAVAIQEEDANGVDYQGFRASLAQDLSDQWSANLVLAHQTIEADGVFFADPTLGDLEIQTYTANEINDEYDNMSLTLEGMIGDLEVIYAGAYTDRETDQIVDYTDYMFVGDYLPYYVCDGSVTYPSGAPAGTCNSPALYVDSLTETEISTHELRFATDVDKRVSATFGLFYSDLELRELNDFTYPSSAQAISFNGTPGFGPNFSAQGANVKDPGQWPAGVIFRNDILRSDEQKGVFGEVTFNVSDTFSIIAGARWYDVEVDLQGSAAGSFGNFGATQDNNAGNNLDTLFSAPNPDTANADGTIAKLTLNWTPTDSSLYYFTYSEGFRPGLLNRPGGRSNPAGTYTVPFAIDTDDLTNFEVGLKTDLLDNTLRFNASLFFSEIERLQTGIFDASIVNLFFSDNAADAEVKGLEGDFIWQPASKDGLSIIGAFSFIDSEITKVITPTNDVVLGDELAYAPQFQFSVKARYEWNTDSGSTVHVMPHLTYSDEAFSDIITINRAQIDDWLLLGFTAGVAKDQWLVEFYAENLTNEKASIANSFIYDRNRVTYTRPLTMGLRLSYDF